VGKALWLRSLQVVALEMLALDANAGGLAMVLVVVARSVWRSLVQKRPGWMNQALRSRGLSAVLPVFASVGASVTDGGTLAVPAGIRPRVR
jgi:Flp pilus assembly protein protease CpaA